MSNKQHTRGWSLAAKMEYHSIPEPNSGCLLWLGGLSGDYPCTSVQGKRREVHRAVLELKLGRSLLPGEQACHKCDVKLCINEDHLFAGSPQDNSADMVQKGRAYRAQGSANGRARLTAEIVVAIRNEPGTLADIANKYGLAFQRVSDIRNGRRWKHVGGPIGHDDQRRTPERRY
jgi:hypothetical protein